MSGIAEVLLTWATYQRFRSQGDRGDRRLGSLGCEILWSPKENLREADVVGSLRHSAKKPEVEAADERLIPVIPRQRFSRVDANEGWDRHRGLMEDDDHLLISTRPGGGGLIPPCDRGSSIVSEAMRGWARANSCG